MTVVEKELRREEYKGAEESNSVTVEVKPSTYGERIRVSLPIFAGDDHKMIVLLPIGFTMETQKVGEVKIIQDQWPS